MDPESATATRCEAVTHESPEAYVPAETPLFVDLAAHGAEADQESSFDEYCPL